MNKTNKKPVAIRLPPEIINRLNRAALYTGLKKNTIIEQGANKRLIEIEKSSILKK